MSARLGTIWYWLGVAVTVTLVVTAVGWNAWTFSQHGKAQRQLDALDAEPAAVLGDERGSGGELDLLLDADRRGILEENFVALLTEYQKRAIAQARHDRLADRAGDRRTSLIFGAVLLAGAIVAFIAGRRAKRRS